MARRGLRARTQSSFLSEIQRGGAWEGGTPEERAGRRAGGVNWGRETRDCGGREVGPPPGESPSSWKAGRGRVARVWACAVARPRAGTSVWGSREEGRVSPERHGCVWWERKSLCCRPIALGAEAGEGVPFLRSPSPRPPRAKFTPRPTRVALCSDPGALGGGREGSGCSKGQGRASFPSSSLPLPSCPAAQSVTNAKLGAWVGTPPEAMAPAWSVPRDSAWAGWITPPKPPPPTPLEGW